MSISIFTFNGKMVIEECCVCGILFAFTEDFKEKRLKDHSRFYCPKGHKQYFSGENEEEKLRKKLNREIARNDQLDASRDEWIRKCETVERSRNSHKGQITKLKNKIKNGICPCCNRTFQNLQRHMKTKHPDFVKENNEKR